MSKRKPPERNLSFGWLRLSRNYSFADKQERTAGRSKVVRKFLPMVETFFLQKCKKARYMLRLFTNLHSKFYFMRAAARQRQHRENGLY